MISFNLQAFKTSLFSQSMSQSKSESTSQSMSQSMSQSNSESMSQAMSQSLTPSLSLSQTAHVGAIAFLLALCAAQPVAIEPHILSNNSNAISEPATMFATCANFASASKNASAPIRSSHNQQTLAPVATELFKPLVVRHTAQGLHSNSNNAIQNLWAQAQAFVYTPHSVMHQIPALNLHATAAQGVLRHPRLANMRGAARRG